MAYAVKYLLVAKLLVGGEIGVAERTFKVASRKTYEDSGASGVASLALKRIEYVVDAFHP